MRIKWGNFIIDGINRSGQTEDLPDDKASRWITLGFAEAVSPDRDIPHEPDEVETKPKLKKSWGK